MKLRFAFVLLFTTSLIFEVGAQSLNPTDSLAYVQRCNVVVSQYDVLNSSYLANCPLKQAGYLIGAMVAKQSSLNDINTFANRLIQNGNAQSQIGNRGFDYAPLMDSYIRWNSYFTNQTKNAFSQFFSTQSSY